MSCPTCDHTMQCVVAEPERNRNVFWCPRCGTIKLCDTEAVRPVLVDRCRKIESEYVIDEHSGHLAILDLRIPWRSSGITEAINLPCNRVGCQGSGMEKSKDPKCPPGHRFLIQLPGVSEAEAHRELRQMFGLKKAMKAVLVRGCHVWPDAIHGPRVETWDAPGFRAYLPI
jgi:hypothetical protein